MQDTRVLPAKRQDGSNCTRRYSKGFKNQNEEHLCSLSCVESTNNIKIKMKLATEL